MNAEEYFAKHSLNPDFIKRAFGVIWNEEKITIPVYDEEGKLLFCKYRFLDFEEKKAEGDKSAKKFNSDPGSHPSLFSVHKIKKVETLVLCEGEPDCMRLWQEEIPSVTSTGGVKFFNSKMALPLSCKKVLLALDTDKAATEEIDKYYQVLLEVGAIPFIVELPEKYKDVSEYFTDKHTKIDFLNLPNFSLDEWLEKHEPKEYSLLDGHSLLNQELPAEEWLIDRLVPSEGFTFIVGAESTGKSFYTLTLANSVTMGTPWLDKFEVKKKTKVLFIDKENTKRRTQSRMRGLGITGENMFWLEYPHYFELSDEKEEDGLSKFAKSLTRKVKKEGIGMIIVDSFTDVMVGNENAAADVQGFFDAMRKLFSNTSIVVLHHVNKPSQGVPRTSAQRTRGSTNIMAQIYSGLYTEATPHVSNEFSIEQIKAGDSEKVQKFKVIMKVEPIEGTDKTKVTKLEYGGEVFDQAQKIVEAMEVITDILNESPIVDRKQILDTCYAEGYSESTTRRAIKQLEEEEMIEEVKNGKFKSYMLLKKEEVRENENVENYDSVQ